MHPHRNRTPQQRLFAGLIAVAIAAAGAYLVPQAIGSAEEETSRPQTSPQSTSAPVPGDARAAHVTRVVDGDTIYIDWDDTPEDDHLDVRLIGIDTPETVDPRKAVQCGGHEASAYTTTHLDGQAVVLEGDSSQDDVDRYDRLLRYVWLPNGTLFNEQLVRQGLAREYTYNLPYRYQAEFLAAQAQAQDDGAGLWSACVTATN